jgi:hypothetical protein
MLGRLLLLMGFIWTVASLLPLSQKNSLLSLFNATSGPFWLDKTNWNASTDPCESGQEWFGVGCNPARDTVTILGFVGNNLTGSLPNLLLPGLTIL